MPRSLSSGNEGINLAESALIGKCWSRQDLADEVKLHKQTIDKFFKGSNIDNINFVKICQALGIDWEEISGSNGFSIQNLSSKDKVVENRQDLKITYQDLLEQELNHTSLKDLDLQLAVNLCN
jgi:DNA-binding Xre family transcriptional regulator